MEDLLLCMFLCVKCSYPKNKDFTYLLAYLLTYLLTYMLAVKY